MNFQTSSTGRSIVALASIFAMSFHPPTTFEAAVYYVFPTYSGAEDSPFISPNGSLFFFFFTPNLRLNSSQQIGDGVTGIWWSSRTSTGWSEPTRVYLGSAYSLDGCELVQGDVMWFCSVRVGNYRGYGMELWFTGYSTLGYPGPALLRSAWNGSGWGLPTEMVSQFAGEPV